VARYALALEFDGAAFFGTQIQSKHRTLQQVMDPALTDLNGSKTSIRFSSRLDQGVSAESLVGDVTLARTWDPATLVLAMAPRLPPDVVVRRAAPVPDDWSALRACTGKTYRYRVVLRPVRPVLDRRCLWVRELDDPARLQACADCIIGRHDLSAFANLRHDHRDAQDPVRTYHEARWIETDESVGRVWTFRISGEGFLYRQVRALVGAMVFVAQTRASVDDFRAAIARRRTPQRLGNLAPAEGLVLERATFAPEPAWD
jgi:tRNA pseudouridine38-40 synthase